MTDDVQRLEDAGFETAVIEDGGLRVDMSGGAEVSAIKRDDGSVVLAWKEPRRPNATVEAPKGDQSGDQR